MHHILFYRWDQKEGSCTLNKHLVFVCVKTCLVRCRRLDCIIAQRCSDSRNAAAAATSPTTAAAAAAATAPKAVAVATAATEAAATNAASPATTMASS